MLRKKIVAAFLLGLMTVFMSFPAMSQTSLQGCLDPRNATICAEVLESTAIPLSSVPIAPIPLGSSAITAIGANGSVLATVGTVPAGVSSVGGVGLMAGSVAAGAAGAGVATGFALGYLSPEAATQLQSQAMTNYCAANPGLCQMPPAALASATYTWQVEVDYTVTASGQRLTGVIQSYSLVGDYPVRVWWESFPGGGGNVMHELRSGAIGVAAPVGSPYSDIAPRIINLTYSLPGGSPQPLLPGSASQFLELPEDRRRAAIDTLSPQQIQDAFSYAPLPALHLPPGTRALDIPGIVGSPFQIPELSSDQDGDGVPDVLDPVPDGGSPGDIDGDGTPDEDDPCPGDPFDGCPFPFEPPPPSGGGSDFVCDEPVWKNPLIPFTTMYDRFPFDLLQTFPESPSATCPSVTILGQTYEFCFIITLLRGFKYCIWVLYSIKVILAL